MGSVRFYKNAESPCGQLAAQFPAHFLRIRVRGLVHGQALLFIEVGVGRFAAGAPVPHPLPVAPAVGAKQRDPLSAERALQLGEHGIEFRFFQDFLKANGILDELKAAGINEGDTVRMYGLAFEYYEE